MEDMTESKWDLYFKKMGWRHFIKQSYAYFLGCLAVLSLLNSWLFWDGMYMYGLALMVCGLFHLAYKYPSKKQKYVTKFNLKEQQTNERP
ncbi:MAG: hypothetical protein ACTJHC_02535 [Vagococcus sp.]